MNKPSLECFNSLSPEQFADLTSTLVTAVVLIWFLGHVFNFIITSFSQGKESDDLDIAIERTIKNYDMHLEETGHWVKKPKYEGQSG